MNINIDRIKLFYCKKYYHILVYWYDAFNANREMNKNKNLTKPGDNLQKT